MGTSGLGRGFGLSCAICSLAAAPRLEVPHKGLGRLCCGLTCGGEGTTSRRRTGASFPESEIELKELVVSSRFNVSV